MKHIKFNYIKKVVEFGLDVLLTGEAGTGKTTVAMQVAEALNKPFSSMSMTKQTSKNDIIGFISIQGTNKDGTVAYVPSVFRKAYEEGHVFLIDEIDASDPNVLLVLNTLTNGYVAFPDKRVEGHKDFRLIATANPQDEHSIYTGRSKLDFSTLDRYYEVKLPRDPALELALTSPEVHTICNISRTILKDNGSSIQTTMRDAIRVQQLTDLGLDESPIEKVVFAKDSILLDIYRKQAAKIEKELEEARKEAERQAKEDAKSQHDMTNLDTLWEKVKQGK